jgi:hypothetical protein
VFSSVLAARAEPPPAEGYLLSTLATLAAARSLRTGRPEAVLERGPEGSGEEPE